MRIGELEKASGLGRDTIRFYEKRGVITPPLRRDNGYREYTEQTLAELRFVRRARELEFSLDEIREAMPRFRPEPPFCDELESRLRDKRETFRAQIREAEAKIAMIDDLLTRLGAATV
ncbi:MerR family transcriptional regulator [Halomonas sp. MCCC 1A17488]|uniref:MerR family transcriptional regulator n=1 Tax=Billgrantia sulfidoxydans TaxID=2733484 RepID=A0ABX7W0H9_9GAMM|nr:MULTISPECIES: MerR family transcriptional regulator [Halomonas]MCE8017172.1 MerR family transcriptional regulator [Halomonas sp. MCCC 1A17488]MCG3240505.1 MerR family transcriptional regulator [Halomonas sp. MCCC 1A17488]QPP49638.1 MerR family transcriptional regulator [Halomonas sp. SS10-MC5]QTP53247.1 MerR family transcriptional regulator [Halomonas sulfidoxydans]